MNVGLRSRSPLFALDERARAILLARLERGVRRARHGEGEVLVGLTRPVAADVDPAAVAFASRRDEEPWFCFEQPDRDGAALATLGEIRRIDARGEGRFTRAAAAWRDLAGRAIGEAPDGPAGAGLVATGGFAFAPDGGAARHWRGFGAGALSVPEVALARRGRDVRLTVAAVATPDDVPADLLARLETRMAELASVPLPMLDPAPTGHWRIASAAPPEHYEAAVARAVERIEAREFEKIVLAREVAVHAPADHDVAAVFGVLRAAFTSCYVFCAGVGDAAFVAASPELLVRREGSRASTVALAGSTRRSADPGVDAHLGERLLRSEKDREEQAIVTRRIERALRPHAVWVTAPEEPAIVRVANIQHLATPIRAQLREPVGAVQLAGLLHPTPAVGGEPHAAATPRIPELEGSTAGGTPARSGGRTPTRTASSASRCAAGSSAAPRPGSTRGSASSANRTPPPSWRRPSQARRAAARAVGLINRRGGPPRPARRPGAAPRWPRGPCGPRGSWCPGPPSRAGAPRAAPRAS
jgi:salicylate biosynthesis isochorismate synthase/menaquinone-specific isochorismate synthase